MNRAAALFLLLAPSIAACGSTPPPVQASGQEGLPAAAEPSAPAGAAGPSSPGSAHALVIQAASCWFGGMWSDAEGATNWEDRRIASEKRCAAIVAQLWGTDDHAKVEAFRRLEKTNVDRLGAEVDRLAAGDPVDGPRKDAIGKLLGAVEAAQREANTAHVAANQVKRDIKDKEEPETLSKDEVEAAKALRTHAAFDALLKLDAGALSAEAHAMALMCAMDRMELSRGLPKHLKIYAVADTNQLVFGVAPPPVPDDATAKLKAGTWLNYLVDAARAAGHPVPDKATHPREREPWAWGGLLEGFTDKLRADAGKLDKGTSLAKAVTAIVARLDAEWAEIPSVAASQRAMAEREEQEKAKKK
jgi:hypothetical protein